MAFIQADRAAGASRYRHAIARGMEWLVQQQQPDGGWGDTPRSLSNISTTLLTLAVLHSAPAGSCPPTSRQRAEEYLSRAGGISAVLARYGRDRTFSVPILMQAALAGLVPWSSIPGLPFELGCLPHACFRVVQLPVVSYALPALIAIGQVLHHQAPTANPLVRAIRNQTRGITLHKLMQIQPQSGGFLEAIPLTSFVVMSLCAQGLREHPVVQRGLAFLERSVRPDGSWPIDVNLSTWVTTLLIQALPEESLSALPAEGLLEWLLAQQHQVVHPYTQAQPGGWAWTPLPGGVPDADDTPSAILALLRLYPHAKQLAAEYGQRIQRAVGMAIAWLLGLQNRDGGWPTFCRGWGALEFDRSAPDITAHVLRALQSVLALNWPLTTPRARLQTALARGWRYLQRQQRDDGAWLPLWFGNQYADNEVNATYGTARVLKACAALGQTHSPAAERAARWLCASQQSDGGWGGDPASPPSLEETALAVEALLPYSEHAPAIRRGLTWLIEHLDPVDDLPAAPIGLYFARLWYYEKLYPYIFAISALRHFRERDALVTQNASYQCSSDYDRQDG